MTKKAWQFVVGAYAISWCVAWLLAVSGVQYGTPLALVMIALFYMTGPALAAIVVQKGIAKQPLKDIGWQWRGTSWKHVLLAVPIVWGLIFGTMALVALVGNALGVAAFGVLDFRAASVSAQLQEFAATIPGANTTPLPDVAFLPYLILGAMLIQGTIAGAIINFPFALGEELGWRGLLHKELSGHSVTKRALITGVIWGLWHAPIILQGHNYPSHPIIGVGMMIVFTTAFSFLFDYLRNKTKSVVGPTVLHGVLNAAAPGVGFFIVGEDSLYGSVVGVAGIVVILLITAVAYRREWAAKK